MKIGHGIVQEFDRSVLIDIYLCGVGMGASLAVAGNGVEPEEANDIGAQLMQSIMNDPLMMEMLRGHILEHLKGAESHTAVKP